VWRLVGIRAGRPRGCGVYYYYYVFEQLLEKDFNLALLYEKYKPFPYIVICLKYFTPPLPFSSRGGPGGGGLLASLCDK